MANTGAITPATVTDPDTSWTTPNNSKVEDGNFASVHFGTGGGNDVLQFSAFGFAVPGGTVDGFVLEVKAKSTTNNPVNFSTLTFQLQQSGANIGNAKTLGVSLTTTLTWYTIGTSADLWGTTLSSSDVNASTFGNRATAVVASGASPGDETVYIDAVRLTIYYTFVPRPFSQGFVIAP